MQVQPEPHATQVKVVAFRAYPVEHFRQVSGLFSTSQPGWSTSQYSFATQFSKQVKVVDFPPESTGALQVATPVDFNVHSTQLLLFAKQNPKSHAVRTLVEVEVEQFPTPFIQDPPLK
eukprot:TRINITY_DN36017_c0_g1_i1.p5 TRINITY_DN36017_c0_g1~~TRINITY_DN36017_c0_g1_i1.p5  ORF type:complete len:118 (-),score=4.60 TRINITY_DN36017_c0_g1_i1:113-466(-)